jgi:hypothetical protein
MGFQTAEAGYIMTGTAWNDVTIMDVTNFYVGKTAGGGYTQTCNANGVTYKWVAF